MIGKRYSAKHKRHLWGFDVYLGDGVNRKRLRIYQFETKDKAQEVLDALKRKEREEKFGLAPLIKRPALEELIEKRLPMIAAKQERRLARRVLYTWLPLINFKIKVDEIKTATVRVYVEKRQSDGRPPATINRELASIAATLNQAGEIFPELEQWKPPKMPRLKVVKSRRERIISD